MAMLDYSEIVLRKYIVLDGEPWEVLASHVFRKQQRKPVNACKLKNLITVCDPKDPSDRFKIDESFIGIQSKFIKKDSVVKSLSFDDKVIGMEIPTKIDLKVIEAHPAVKGNTAQGGTKVVKLETGAEINVPMFIKEGEIVRVNSETGEYSERVGGANF
ncbi:MAG: Elongation factor P [Parcubacteria group bacterium GW2011_GWB1_40_5]|nr:MAG: Elongation factor P [Parcubacteria group bacterium GW2011_GWB1_40_5]